MSVEQKYYMTHKQIDYLLSLNKTISIIGPMFSIFLSILVVNIITRFINENKYSNTMIALFSICSFISGFKLFTTIKDKKYLMQKIEETAHYEIIVTEKNEPE